MDSSRTVLARGARDGWYLLTAGIDDHGAPLAQVLDLAIGAIYPPQPAPPGAGRGWRPFAGDADPILAAAAVATALDRPAVVAHQGDHRYLLTAGTDGYGLDLAQILDVTTGRLFSPSTVESVVKHGGWEHFDGDPAPVLAAAASADALPPPPPRRPPRGRRRAITADQLAARAARAALRTGEPGPTDTPHSS